MNYRPNCLISKYKVYEKVFRNVTCRENDSREASVDGRFGAERSDVRPLRGTCVDDTCACGSLGVG